MSADLFIGITRRQESPTLVAIVDGTATSETLFPNSAMSATAIRIHLNDQEGPVGLGFDGSLIEFASGWGRGNFAQATWSAPGVGASAGMLARYASHAP